MSVYSIFLFRTKQKDLTLLLQKALGCEGDEWPLQQLEVVVQKGFGWLRNGLKVVKESRTEGKTHRKLLGKGQEFSAATTIQFQQ